MKEIKNRAMKSTPTQTSCLSVFFCILPVLLAHPSPCSSSSSTVMSYTRLKQAEADKLAAEETARKLGQIVAEKDAKR